jgi:transcriptional regulator with XRE-family HTH domain
MTMLSLEVAMSGFAANLQEVMRSERVGVLELARRAGVSRQTVYNLLQPGYDPISPGVRKVARALHVDPRDLLPREDDLPVQAARILDVLRAAARRKESRAFEVLPALLAEADPGTLASIRPSTDAEVRVLGAASAMAAELTGQTHLGSLAEALLRLEDPHQALFFGRLSVDPVAVIERTPASLRTHRVFGAFTEDLFRRHLARR